MDSGYIGIRKDISDIDESTEMDNTMDRDGWRSLVEAYKRFQYLVKYLKKKRMVF